MFASRYFADRYFARRYFPQGANTAQTVAGATADRHRYRSAVVPPFTDIAEVQRFLQRALDEIAIAFNPTMVVADGGTGIESLVVGEVLSGGDTPDAFARIPGNLTATRKFLVSQGTGSAATIPFWDTLQAGDIPGAGGPDVGVVASGVGVVASGVDVIT